MSNKQSINRLSVTDQNIKLQIRQCIRWIFKTSGDSEDQYVPYINGWLQWLSFGVRNAYHNVMTGWIHAKLDTDSFIDGKRIDELLKKVCEEEVKRAEK